MSTPPSLSGRVATGAIWMTAGTIASRVVVLLAQLALTWLLAPEHFGRIALVYTITGVTSLLTQPGIDDVLLQKHRHIRRWTTPALWMSLACGLAGAAAMVLIGGGVVRIAESFGNKAYGNPQVFWMVLILATGAPLNAGAVVPMIMLSAQMRFARSGAFFFGEIFAQQTLTVTLAALGFGAYSFVIPMPIVAAVRLLLLMLVVRPPVRFQLALHRWPALVSATRWVFGYRILLALTLQGDSMLLGAICGSEVLVGYYFFALMFTLQVLRILNENAVVVLQPALASIQDDVPRMHAAAERASRALHSVVTPLLGLQILLAGPAIRLLFAAKWEPTIVLIQILSAGPLLYTTAWPMRAMLNAQGRFKTSFKLWVLLAISYFGIVATCTWIGQAVGAALGVCIWWWLASAAYAVAGYAGVAGIAVMLRVVWPRLAALAVAAAPAVLVIAAMPKSAWHDALTIAIMTPLVLVVYTFALRLIDRETVDGILEHARLTAGSLLRRLRGRAD